MEHQFCAVEGKDAEMENLRQLCITLERDIATIKTSYSALETENLKLKEISSIWQAQQNLSEEKLQSLESENKVFRNKLYELEKGDGLLLLFICSRSLAHF